MKKTSYPRQKIGRMSLDVLARMVKHGFDEQTRTLSRRIVASNREVKEDVEILRREAQAEFREVRSEIATLRETVQALSVSVDKLVKVITDLREEYAAIKVQLDRHERWIQELAKKSGVALRV